MKGKVTPARARALEVLVTHGRARIGLGMYEHRPHDPVVTPAGAGWLIDMGYAQETGTIYFPLRPTRTGIAAHEALR